MARQNTQDPDPAQIVQYIETAGQRTHVILPLDYYETLLSDEALFDKAREEDTGTRYPGDVVDRILDGDSPLKVVREWRKMTQSDLADKAEVTKNFISMLETGKRKLTSRMAHDLAAALDVDADILVE